jgi:hypothetical protein
MLRSSPSTWDTSLAESALLDAAVDSYVEWREESAALRAAYRRWSDASASDRTAAFAAYTAALDREARASDLYAAVLAYFVGVHSRRSRRCQRKRFGLPSPR